MDILCRVAHVSIGTQECLQASKEQIRVSSSRMVEDEYANGSHESWKQRVRSALTDLKKETKNLAKRNGMEQPNWIKELHEDEFCKIADERNQLGQTIAPTEWPEEIKTFTALLPHANLSLLGKFTDGKLKMVQSTADFVRAIIGVEGKDGSHYKAHVCPTCGICPWGEQI